MYTNGMMVGWAINVVNVEKVISQMLCEVVCSQLLAACPRLSKNKVSRFPKAMQMTRMLHATARLPSRSRVIGTLQLRWALATADF
jgi:hypothetical protein